MVNVAFILEDILTIFCEEIIKGSKPDNFKNYTTEQLYYLTHRLIEERHYKIENALKNSQIDSVADIVRVACETFDSGVSFGRLLSVLAFIRIILERNPSIQTSLAYELCVKFNSSGILTKLERIFETHLRPPSQLFHWLLSL